MTTHQIVSIKRSQTKYNDPMWICELNNGQTVFQFTTQKGNPNAPLAKMWIESGYDAILHNMAMNQVDSWQNHPIAVDAKKAGDYWQITRIEPKPAGAKPDHYPKPDLTLFEENISLQFGWLLKSSCTIIDTETTGTNPNTDEIVSIAAISPEYNRFDVSNCLYIQPQHPEKLLVKNADGISAFDINGIHPDYVADAPTFVQVYDTLRESLQYTHWVCWNADYDVTLLDSLCIRHNLPIIPRLSVTCAMKLLTPLFGEWDTKTGVFKWTKLEYVAHQLGVNTEGAHDAYADVCMTRDVMLAIVQKFINESDDESEG